tara:strand:- start:4840 stop:6777 length:1938 start_codon:yes stop_codon:yes gene_type:complete
MKIVYSHLLNFLKKKPSLAELSDKLFQLGHEHEIEGEVLDLEITPNRGDCLSLKGIARDLNHFYKADLDTEHYDADIPESDFSFENKAEDLCPNISFVEIEVEGKVKAYAPYLESYFQDLKLNKNNLFTDISNYLAYETGQPTHCYDATKINGPLVLEKRNKQEKFKTLLGSEIELKGENLVFTINDVAVDLAGTMGDESTSCSENTMKVLVECAYFKPEEILGKARQYNLNSEASYKFERGVDFLAQEQVLRRFIAIVSDHVKIKSLALKTEQRKKDKREVEFDSERLNKIIGTDLTETEQKEYLNSLYFKIDDKVVVPSHRSDIDQLNDLAEEVTRMIGYDNIASKALALPVKAKKIEANFEDLCRSYLINNGFFEVVNFPFNDNQDEAAISVDNPLDKQRSKMRVCITKSIKENVVFNQNRQKDSMKFFEFSDIYTKDGNEKKLAVIVSGRTNKNFKEFNAQLDYSYLKGLINTIFFEILGKELNFELDQSKNYDLYETVYCDDVQIGRIGKLSKEFVGSKTKTPVFSFEIVLNNLQLPAKKQSKISDFPASYRDLSFSLDSHENLEDLSAMIKKHKKYSELMTDCFVFDLFENKKQNILKVGYRFKFQAIDKNITDEETEAVMNPLIEESLEISGVSIEGI